MFGQQCQWTPITYKTNISVIYQRFCVGVKGIHLSNGIICDLIPVKKFGRGTLMLLNIGQNFKGFLLFHKSFFSPNPTD
jgi:accessory gene regulator protein AgrB